MNLSEVLLTLVVYLLPMLFFFYMGLDVLVRNPKKTEHRLVSLITACYFLLFLEEYVRFLLPINYSPPLTAIMFSSIGIMLPGLGFHFFAKITRMDMRLPKLLNPYIFYVHLLIIPINIFGNKNFISSQKFITAGVWKWPVFNSAYYAGLTVSILISALTLLILFKAKSSTSSPEYKAIFNLMIVGTILTLGWTGVFGYFRFGEKIPPFPYLYAGIIWCFLLQLAMKKYEFLNFNNQRYEKLFNLNPAAILLIEISGIIKEANPSARLMLNHIDLDHAVLNALASAELSNSLKKRQEIKELETSIQNGDQFLDVLIDGDYVTVDNQPHVILIIRNITLQKENQKQIVFLAYHDPLTLLPNRRYFYEKLAGAINEAKSLGHHLAVILIDLDDFKDTNDRYGHEAGDEVLRHTAHLIKEVVGQKGVAARLGGDEFVLFLSPVPSISYVQDTLQQLETKFLHSDLQYKDKSLTIKMSMGFSFYPEDGQDEDTILNNADKAMYRTKRNRKQLL
ncbi:GGDEF domain-containing protein [Paenibacillus wynnii]|uniref:GGDEF domain-containing protein n=1 Tax=Paenibacillus wynnii TaxID=268407 RepID=UPI002794288E|nr:sensor domain-containing diguanylate cyclase [Paenibacillus wynnii]MDQ0193098.1 diguanylate cyclase (GGDEF)-like protein [Paenibacillus wynnii]